MKPKMLPEGAGPNEGLEASGVPLGAMWAQSGRQGGAQAPLRPPLSGSWGGSWRLLGPSWGPLGASWASPGPPGGLPVGLREVIFGAFFGGRRRDPEISCFLMMIVFFSILFRSLF